MLDMTIAGQVGLFVGAWGMSNAISRLVGSILGGVGRDVIAAFTGKPTLGYIVVFGIMAIFMVVSLLILTRINVGEFKENVEQSSIIERAAIAGDA